MSSDQPSSQTVRPTWHTTSRPDPNSASSGAGSVQLGSSPGSSGGAGAAPRRGVGVVQRLRELRRVVLGPVCAFTTVVAGWWLAVESFDIEAFFLPAPPQVAAALAQHRGYLLVEAWVTLGHTLGGFAAAAAAGALVALALVASDRVRQATFPLLVALQAVPKVAVAPLLVVWLGFGPGPKIVLVTLLCFFPVLVNTLAGLSTIPAEAEELARSLAASRWQTLTKLRIWYALPQMFVGLKVAISLALIGAVVAQITTPNAGLGAIIVRSGQAADTPLAFAAITLLAVIGISLYYTLVGLERLAVPWARATTA